MCLFVVSVVMKPPPGSDYSQQDSSPVSILTVSILVFALLYKGAKSVVVILVCVFPCLRLCSTYKVFSCGSTCVRYGSSTIQYTLVNKWIKNLLAEIFHLNAQKFKNLISQARSSRFLYVGHF